MRCSKCQAENPDTRKFCRACGANLTQLCPRCGAENLPGDNFCGECGCSLQEARAAASIDYSEPRSYIPKFLADKTLTTRSAIEGERKLVSILFADVVDYTSIASRLDPEEVHQLMDGCFRVLMNEIHKYEGTIDKFTGDGVMALFRAPVAREDHVQRACYAALAIRTAIEEFGDKVKKDSGLDFKIRLGLNSGPVIAGSIGNNLRMDYTAIGDTTNLASRMQEAAKPGTILVSHDTYKSAGDFFEFKPVGRLRVKGKAEALEAYELLEVGRVETRFEVAIARGLTRFVGREKEIAALKESFERATAGSGQVVGVVGEAGVGKSRLILETLGILPKGKYSYLEGRCLHYGRATAYLPLLDILRSYFDMKEGEREFAIRCRRCVSPGPDEHRQGQGTTTSSS